MIKNNKKGFTLVELLAVMSVLAIIALIAVPVVTDTVRKAKDKASLVNAELYLKAAHEAILEYKLEDEDRFYPETCTVDGKDLICDDVTIKVKVKGNPPDGGTIIYKNEEISRVAFKYGTKKIKNNSEGILVFDNSICSYDVYSIPDENTFGAKYSCEVKPGTNYTFFILSKNEDGTTNLIMDRNICEDGTLTTNENKCLAMVAWYTSSSNLYGPVAAMDFLYNATKDWINIPNIEMNYKDEGNGGNYGYGTIITSDNITKITKQDGTKVTVLTNQEGYSNLKARMPYKSEISSYDRTNKTNAFLYDYLRKTGTIQTNEISWLSAYWILSSASNESNRAHYVSNTGHFSYTFAGSGSGVGVRPVITLKLQ